MNDYFLPKQLILITSREHIEVMGSSLEKDDIYPIITHTTISNTLNQTENDNNFLIVLDKSDFIHELISKSRVFCVNLVPYEFLKDINICRQNNGKFVDKFKKTSLKKLECTKIDCPRIVQADFSLEYEVITEFELDSKTVFVGKQIYFNKNSDHSNRIFLTKNNEFKKIIL